MVFLSVAARRRLARIAHRVETKRASPTIQAVVLEQFRIMRRLKILSAQQQHHFTLWNVGPPRRAPPRHLTNVNGL